MRAEANSNRLPDCRAYELVTPPYKEGAAVGQLDGMSGIAPDGEHLIGTSLGVFAGSEDGALGVGSRLLGTAYGLSRGADGWEASALGPPELTYRSAGMYDAGADLSTTLWGLGRLTQPEGVSDLYVERPRGTFTEVGPPTPEPNAVNAEKYTYLGASADLSHVLFSTAPGYRWPFDETLAAANTLYEYVGTGNSSPSPVGVSGGAGSTELVSQCGTYLGSSATGGARGSMYNAVSADGARVFFTAVGEDDQNCGARQPSVDELFAREEQAGETQTVPISVSSLSECSGGSSSSCADANFEGASRDGSKVFFTSTAKLTEDASEDSTSGDSAVGLGAPPAETRGCARTVGTGGCNLYEDELSLSGSTPIQRLVALSAGNSEPRVQGLARISADGSHVYFIARGALSSRPNTFGDGPVAGGENLYVYERDAAHPTGHTSFIATLSPEDERDWARADDRPVLASDEGRFLAFTSRADLTHEGIAPGVAQVFQYDALTESLVRASVGESGFDNDGRTPAYGATLATQQADLLDSPTSTVGTSTPEDGAVFFESPNALAPQALDDQIDGLGEPVPNVYEYRAGSLSLISDGRDHSTLDGAPGVHLLGSDLSGGDAFLTTVDSLVAQDTDTQQDIYDTRTEGGFPAPQPSPSCVGEACQGPPRPSPTLLLVGGATGTAGGTHPAARAGDAPLSAPAAFGIEDFAMQALDAGSAPETQAGGHPESLTTSFDFDTSSEQGAGGPSYQLTGSVRDIVLDLPLGLTLDPQAAPRCPLYALALTARETACPAASRVGTLALRRIGEGSAQIQESEPLAVYDMVPEAGYPMEFGASFSGVPVLMYGSVVRMGSGYGLRLAVPGIPGIGIVGVSLTLFGDPAQRDGTAGAATALLTNPVDCAEGSSPARLEVDTWQDPGQYKAHEAMTYPAVTGCEALQFQPTISLAPETTLAGEPSGDTIDVRTPQDEDPSRPATPEMKSAIIVLPSGVSISPAAAGGLLGCPATGPDGIDIGGSESAGSDGAELAPDGLYHTAPGHCPAASTIGTVMVQTPLLAQPLEGHVFVACGEEGEGPCGEGSVLDAHPIGVYLEVAGSGVVVKIAGRISVDESTGQLTLSFDTLPQLSVSRLTLDLKGGPRAVLINPETCGTATTTGHFSAWSSPDTPSATASSAFEVTECLSQPLPMPPQTPPAAASTPPPTASQAVTPPTSAMGQAVKPAASAKVPKKAKKAKHKPKHKPRKRHGRRSASPKHRHGRGKTRRTRPKRGER